MSDESEVALILRRFEESTEPFDEHDVDSALLSLKPKDDKDWQPPTDYLAERTAFAFDERVLTGLGELDTTLYATTPDQTAINAGDALGQLPVRVPVVTVGGTNGKGSTVAVLEALLTEAGKAVGAFTSPHLLRFNERIRIGGREVADGEIIEAFAAIDKARAAVSLTYFEFATLAALYIFRSYKPDVIVLEVGLGGRLDAVNIVDPAVCVITSIALDHQDWLGNSRDQIALEKAGILRPGVPVVVADEDPPAGLLERIAEVGAAPAIVLGRQMTITGGETHWHMTVRDSAGRRRDLPPVARGPLVAANLCAAVQACLLLGLEVDDARLPGVLAGVALSGRRQRLALDGLDCVFDVAHNPAAVDKLVEYLDATYCKGRTFAIFSAMADKDLEGMLAGAADQIDCWFLADQPDNARAAPAADVAEILNGMGEEKCFVSADLDDAFATAYAAARAGDRLVVFGSFYTVGAVLRLVQSRGCPEGELSR